MNRNKLPNELGSWHRPRATGRKKTARGELYPAARFGAKPELESHEKN